MKLFSSSRLLWIVHLSSEVNFLGPEMSLTFGEERSTCESPMIDAIRPLERARTRGVALSKQFSPLEIKQTGATRTTRRRRRGRGGRNLTRLGAKLDVRLERLFHTSSKRITEVRDEVSSSSSGSGSTWLVAKTLSTFLRFPLLYLLLLVRPNGPTFESQLYLGTKVPFNSHDSWPRAQRVRVGPIRGPSFCSHLSNSNPSR